MPLSDLLTSIEFQAHEQPFVAVDPATRFAIVATENGPERVDSAHRRVVVPLFAWKSEGTDENEEIVKVLVEAAAMNPLKVPSPRALDETFWVKHSGWKGLLCNAGLFGKFLIPDGPIVITSEHVPMSQVVLIGPGAGFFVKQGARRGVISNRAQGLMQLQFFTV